MCCARNRSLSTLEKPRRFGAGLGLGVGGLGSGHQLARTVQVVAAARERRVFVMEAMWTRFFPLMESLRSLLASHAIGDVKMLSADFGFKVRSI